MALTERFIQRKARTDVSFALKTYVEGQPWQELTMPFFTNGQPVVTMEWFGDLPAIRKWEGERVIHALKNQSYTLTGEPWEMTLGVTLDMVKDQESYNGLLKPKFDQMGESFAEHPNVRLAAAMVSTTELGPDGVTLFSAAHPKDGGGTNTNIISGSGVTKANLITDWQAFRQAVTAVTMRNGQPMFHSLDGLEFVIYHAPANDVAFQDVFVNESLGTSDEIGRLRNEPVTVKSWAFLTGNDWYIFIKNRSMKPYIYYEIEKPMFEWDDKGKFSRKEMAFGGSSRYDIKPGWWPMAWKVDN